LFPKNPKSIARNFLIFFVWSVQAEKQKKKQARERARGRKSGASKSEVEQQIMKLNFHEDRQV
jgi:hypothetical protein